MITQAEKTVDPHASENQIKPLWCIYGYKCFPNVLACMIQPYRGGFGPTIWGYSVYRGEPGYRTLGQNLDSWISENGHDMCLFFDDQQAMLEYLKKLTTIPTKVSTKLTTSQFTTR